MKIKLIFPIIYALVSGFAFAQTGIQEPIQSVPSITGSVGEVFSLGPGDRYMVFDDSSLGFSRKIDVNGIVVSGQTIEPESTAIVILADGSFGYMFAKTVKFYQDLSVTGDKSTYSSQLLRGMLSDIYAVERLYERTKQVNIASSLGPKKYEADGIKISSIVSSEGCSMNLLFDNLKWESYKLFVKAALEIDKTKCLSVNVDLSGVGGSVASAIKIGILIRRNKWTTSFGGWREGQDASIGKCMSSCAIAFFGGVKRSRNGSALFQYHQPARQELSGKKSCISVDEDKLNLVLSGYMQTTLQDSENVVFKDLSSVSCNEIRNPNKNLEAIIFNN